MSLIGALNIGKSALAVQQAAMQVTANNLANAANPDYSRQVARAQTNPDQLAQGNVYIGTGVTLTGVSRQVDEALNQRIRGAVADNVGAKSTQQWLSRIESLFNELSDQDISSQLSTFFASWSNLANKPQDIGLRQIVVQSGVSMAQSMNGLASQLDALRSDVDQRLQGLAKNADDIAKQIADLNGQIAIAEGSARQPANGLRDQRDGLLKQLSEFMDIKTIPTDETGSVVNVFVGSQPLVINAESRGVGIKQTPLDEGVKMTVIYRADNGAIDLRSGELGSLIAVRDKIQATLDSLNTQAGALIHELNKVHSSGQGLEGFNTLTSLSTVSDPSAALNDKLATGLDFAPKTGSFVVHVRDKSTGLVTSTLINVDLEGTGSDTSLTDLTTAIDAVPGVAASIQAGRLRIDSESSNLEFSFSQDTSGALASLGVNTFFTGSNAASIAVSASVQANPSSLAASMNGEPADNQTARRIAALETAALGSLNNQSLKSGYEGMINGISASASAARNSADASQVVLETLTSQREALAGVSLDEEAINLMRQQRAFQGAAKLISAVDEMLQTVIGLLR